MANYVATGRSNYFSVKDPEKLAEFCAKYNLESWHNNKKGLYAFTSANEGGLYSDLGPDEPFHFDQFVQDLASNLQENQVAVYQEVGNEKLHYVNGYSLAVHSSGKVVEVSIEDIYEKAAREFGVNEGAIELASY